MSEAQIADAYKEFMDASRRRDDDPDQFSSARTRYYGLKNGDEWLEQERIRILKEKINPAIGKYAKMYNEIINQIEIQKAYSDSAEIIRDQQSNIKTNYNNNTSYFGKLIKQEDQQQYVYNRFMELTSPQKGNSSAPIQPSSIPFMVKLFMNYPPEFVSLLNIIAISLGITIAYVGYQKYKQKKSASTF